MDLNHSQWKAERRTRPSALDSDRPSCAGACRAPRKVGHVSDVGEGLRGDEGCRMADAKRNQKIRERELLLFRMIASNLVSELPLGGENSASAPVV